MRYLGGSRYDFSVVAVCSHTVEQFRRLAGLAVEGAAVFGQTPQWAGAAAMIGGGVWAAVQTSRSLRPFTGEGCNLADALCGDVERLTVPRFRHAGVWVPQSVPGVRTAITSTLGAMAMGGMHVDSFGECYFGLPVHRKFAVFLGRRGELHAWSVFPVRWSQKIAAAAYKSKNSAPPCRRDRVVWWRIPAMFFQAIGLGGPLAPFFQDRRVVSLGAGSGYVVCRSGGTAAWCESSRVPVAVADFARPTHTTCASIRKIDLRGVRGPLVRVRFMRSGITFNDQRVDAEMYSRRYDRKLGGIAGTTGYVHLHDLCLAVAGQRKRSRTRIEFAVCHGSDSMWIHGTTGRGAKIPWFRRPPRV